MNQKNYRIEIVKKVDEKLIRQWKQLWEKADNSNIYNSYEWFLTSIEVSNNKKYELYLCYKNTKLVAVLPLQRYKCFGVNVLGTLNKEHLAGTPFLMETYDKEIFTYFFSTLLRKDSLYLQKVDNKAAIILQEFFPAIFFSLLSVNPSIDLTGDPYSFASQSTINQVKKIIRKNPDQLHFETYTNNLMKHLDTMFALQKKSSKNARSIDIFAKEENKYYYESLTKNCSYFVRINILYYGEEPITYEYGFLCKDNYIGDQISYHNEYKKLSPGKTMMFHLLAYLKKKNIKSLDMGGGVNSYKMSFTDKYTFLYNGYYSSNSFIMMWWKMINKVRRLKQIFFPKKFTKDHEFLFKTLN